MMKNYIVLLILAAISITPALGAQVSLQAAYDACGPGEGYDKLLRLDPANVYTGMLTVTDSVRSCIHGNGAVISLNALTYRNSIRAWGQSTVLDMDHCIIRGANEAVGLHDGVSGTFMNNTFYDCDYGIYVWDAASATAYNNIIAFGPAGAMGFARLEGATTVIHHDDIWLKHGGAYMEYCPG
jgi:parallel beta-helix repeat protein